MAVFLFHLPTLASEVLVYFRDGPKKHWSRWSVVLFILRVLPQKHLSVVNLTLEALTRSVIDLISTFLLWFLPQKHFSGRKCDLRRTSPSRVILTSNGLVRCRIMIKHTGISTSILDNVYILTCMIQRGKGALKDWIRMWRGGGMH
jgi:hypothetical protein